MSTPDEGGGRYVARIEFRAGADYWDARRIVDSLEESGYGTTHNVTAGSVEVRADE